MNKASSIRRCISDDNAEGTGAFASSFSSKIDKDESNNFVFKGSRKNIWKRTKVKVCVDVGVWVWVWVWVGVCVGGGCG